MWTRQIQKYCKYSYIYIHLEVYNVAIQDIKIKHLLLALPTEL